MRYLEELARLVKRNNGMIEENTMRELKEDRRGFLAKRDSK